MQMTYGSWAWLTSHAFRTKSGQWKCCAKREPMKLLHIKRSLHQEPGKGFGATRVVIHPQCGADCHNPLEIPRRGSGVLIRELTEVAL